MNKQTNKQTNICCGLHSGKVDIH